nr:methyl-CpG-binding domain-containing protein 2-like isoform X1 [Tanacetum cinerariifolium]
MLEKHQLTGPNFNEWFRALKLVVRTEKLQDVFETALPPAPTAGADAQALADWPVLFYRHNEVACLMLGTMSLKLYQLFEHNSPLEMVNELQKNVWKTSGVELQELVNMFHSCKKAKGQSVSDHVLLMKSYLDQLATLNYAFPDKASIKKTISKVHSLLIEFEKSIKRNKQPIIGASSTPQVMAIQGGRVQKYKPQGKAKGKGKAELMKKKKKTGGQNIASTSSVSMNNMLYFNSITVNGIYEIDMRDSTLPIVNSMYSISNKRTKSNLDSTYLWHCRLAHINKKRIEKLQHGGLSKSIDNESFDQCVSCISGKMIRKHFSHKIEKVKDVFGLIHTDVCGPLRHVSKKESAARILNMVPTKKVDKTPYELWHGKVPSLSYLKKTMGYYFYYPPENKIVVERYADFLEKDFILQKESGRIVELEDEDILPSENTSEHPIEEESLVPIISQEEDVIPVRRSVRTHKAHDRLCLNVEIDPDQLSLSDPEFEKWLVAMNAKMQSMYDNKVWRLVVLPPNAKVVKSKCTRPDVAFTQNITSRFQQSSGEAYWTAVKNILKYLRNTKDTFLVFGGNPEAGLRVNCYCDVRFETDRDGTKSQTGYVFVLNGGAVVWKSSKQSTTTQHATEAEYIAASEAAKEAGDIKENDQNAVAVSLSEDETDDEDIDDETSLIDDSHKQMVIYDPPSNGSVVIRGVQNPDPERPRSSSRRPPEVAAFTVQCANCFKWRLIPDLPKYEVIREHITDQPFLCETTRQWGREITCDDPTDIKQDGTQIWAIDKPNIAKPPPGYYTSPTGAKLRSLPEVQKFLENYPEHAQGIGLGRFSFQIPKPLVDNYVRKRPSQTTVPLLP